MAIQLTAADYHTLDWDLFAQKKIDSVSGDVLCNRIGTEVEQIYNTTSVEATIEYNEAPGTIDLSQDNFLGNGQVISYYYTIIGEATPLLGASWTAQKSRREMVWARGSLVQTIDVPIEGSAVIEVQIAGKRYEANTETLSWDALPSDDRLRSTEALDTWVLGLSLEPQRGTFTPADITNGWSPEVIDYGTLKVYPRFSMYKGPNYPEGTLKPYATITPTGNTREYQIDWAAPIKDIYVYGGRKKNFWGQPGDFYEGKLIAVVAESMVFTVSGRPYSTEKVSFNYALQGSSKEYPFRISPNELMTISSTLNNSVWSDEISRILITKYEGGKLTAKAKVRPKWLLHNDVHINTLVEISNIRGVKIGRKGTAAVFQVKSIEKAYNSSEFVFDVCFQEV